MIASTQGLANDSRTLDALRNTAAKDPKAAVREAAKQFEAVFMQQLLKSMREATQSTGLMDNDGSKLGTEMLDTQFATSLSGTRGGLADVIARQLERQIGTVPNTAALPDVSNLKIPGKQAAFVQQHQQAANAVAGESGIPAAFMLGQAAHESGWGQREIRNADGSSAHNLFGIKAGPGWTGKVAEVTTTEYVDGVAQKQTAKFRAYDSAEASFRDYARLIQDNPRYQQAYRQALSQSASGSVDAAGASSYAAGLQRAGYATDPAYADKLTRVINTTLRLQRVNT